MILNKGDTITFTGTTKHPWWLRLLIKFKIVKFKPKPARTTIWEVTHVTRSQFDEGEL